MLILLCRNNMIARKNQGVNPWFSFFLDSFDALARVSWEPLAAPAMSLTSLRQIRSYGFSVFRAKRAKRPKPCPWLWGLGGRSRVPPLARAALSKRFGPAPPRCSTPLNKKTRVKAPQKLRPAVAALAFFSLRLPCLVLRLVRLRSLAALLGRVPPAGARLSPLAVLPASPAFALRAPSRLSAAGLSLGRYRSRRSLCVFAAPPLFLGSCLAFRWFSTTPPPRQSWRGAQGSQTFNLRLVISSAIA